MGSDAMVGEDSTRAILGAIFAWILAWLLVGLAALIGIVGLAGPEIAGMAAIIGAITGAITIINSRRKIKSVTAARASH